jgi:hypothetical protein
VSIGYSSCWCLDCLPGYLLGIMNPYMKYIIYRSAQIKLKVAEEAQMPLLLFLSAIYFYIVGAGMALPSSGFFMTKRKS